MKHYKFDVIVIGAGPSGVAAAGALAGKGISVALIEAGVYAGAENWSGCVYFTENLAQPDCFGTEKVEAAPFERRVVRRGTLLHNGLDVLGFDITDAALFKNCYTVLRPVYDPYFANLARIMGAVHLSETTVTSLVRKGGRVIGVETDRGPLFAGVTFIAEGDASHLVRSEQLERIAEPHFLQGVKAVLSLKPDEIEKRFGLSHGEGAAYELLLRNPSIAGRTAWLNMGGFLYTNRDSLSVGYVAPLENIRDNYRGSHDALFEWMLQLPYIREATEGATLSAYGTKIIRSGGWHERPVLVQDGLAVGGASGGLGVDMPFPNFTGPASATGLYFARAVRSILKQGGSFDSKQLSREYLQPLHESVYGRNAEYLSKWPFYFGRSKVLFGRTVDLACGSAHFLSAHGVVQTARFMRSHILSLRGLKEMASDNLRAVKALRLSKPIIKSLINPTTLAKWITNFFKKTAAFPEPGILVRINGRSIDPAGLPWPVGPMIRRMSPSILLALKQVYANDGRLMQNKLSDAAALVVQGLRLTDFIIFPVFVIVLFFISLATAVWDALRFYVLKTPIEKLLAEPVMTYNEAQKKMRDLEAVKPRVALDAKLATNTYRVGSEPHIRTVWPDAIPLQPEMSQAGLWWVCPAKVYLYAAPPFAGRGRVTVNYENCIKCESCWRAVPDRALWGRHTGHKLIYRPESAALDLLLHSLATVNERKQAPAKNPELVEDNLFHPTPGILDASLAALNASAAFVQSVREVPASADKARIAWPLSQGRRLTEKLLQLEQTLLNDSRHQQAVLIESERKALEVRLDEKSLFHAVYCCRRMDDQIKTRIRNVPAAIQENRLGILPDSTEPRQSSPAYETVSQIFPDRIVKQWEDQPMPEEWARKLSAFIFEHRNMPLEVVRVLSSVNPAFGLIASHQLYACSLLSQTGISAEPGIIAVPGDHLDTVEMKEGLKISGSLNLVPCAASTKMLVLSRGRAYALPFSAPGVRIIPTPAVGFRASGLSDILLDCIIDDKSITAAGKESIPGGAFYLATALGAGDYLSRRVKDHASERIQFPGQMLDTEGRDGIAKLGAVKGLIARTEAWRLLLQALYDLAVHSAVRTPHSGFDTLCSTVAAMAFSPEPGTMGYDAGQVFGGFAYSEDELLSRFYRDSALFRFLPPGYGAAAQLNNSLLTGIPDEAFGIPHSAFNEQPLHVLAARLMQITQACAGVPGNADANLAGNAKALVIAIRALLASVESGLNQGRSMEAEAAGVEVLLGLAQDAFKQAELSCGGGSVSPCAVFPVEPAGRQVALDMDYESFCTANETPHKSGMFLISAFDRSPRFVPEMQLHDANLRLRWTELTGWFRKNCSEKQFDGLHIERYIEKVHRLPGEVIEAVKTNKWLATYIPKSLDGLGWHKAEYYILNSAAGSFGDAGIDLLIMASTSIGTTPILLGLEEELPRVREELAPFVQDQRKLGEIGLRLAKLVESLSSPNPGWLKKEYEAIMRLVDDRIRRSRVVKYLSANFLKAFYGAGIAGRRGDFAGFISNLKHANGLFAGLLPDIRAALDELPRRERCHKLFLRCLGHGAVSAFALTEPTAGSDSGGVRTTAKRQSSKLTKLEDGRYSFVLSDGDEKNTRYLIDADSVVFAERGMAYETPDGKQAAIKYDRYDYSADQGIRYYRYEGEDREFHDIGQVRKTDSGLAYEYYVMTGAKMWITNGSIATQFCLYAQTPEGVTGFMVDRHAEGLKIGADEKKTGQRGSPTNEISIDNVRVPREAVIGYEGHGQVNALETLNVGRCGLAVVSGALMRKLMQEAMAFIPASPERDRLLGEAAAVLFGSESLAYYLVGLFDRPHVSVRMESAIAKYLCSEDIHELLSLVERAFGPVGQTEKFLLEKARRDSRILTIYEGTNEVQRFLILKDLIAHAAAWHDLAVPETDEHARILSTWKNKLRNHVKKAADLLGDASWSDAMLQPALFPLPEMAGEILRLECIYYRMEWLSHRSSLLSQASQDYAPMMLTAGERAAERAIRRLGHLEEKYASSWQNVTDNMDMPEVRAADAALDRITKKQQPLHEQQGLLQAPFRILSIIRPVADLSPQPRLSAGAVRELVWKIDPEDLAALAQALNLKTAGNPDITVDVLMPGGSEHESLIRMAAGSRADSLHRLNINPDAGPDAYVETVRDLEAFRPYDLIAVGDNSRNGEQGLGAYLAGSLKKLHYRRERIEIKQNGTGLNRIALPAVICITEAAAQPLISMTEAVASDFSSVRITQAVARPASRSRFDLPAGSTGIAKTVTRAPEAAEYLRTFAASISAASAEEYRGQLNKGTIAETSAVRAVLDPNELRSNVAVLRAAKLAAELKNHRLNAVIPAPEHMWPHLLGLARSNGCEQAFCIDSHGGRLSRDGKHELLRKLMKAPGKTLIFAGMDWTSSLAFIVGETDTADDRTLHCSGVTGIQKEGARLAFSLPAYEGRLVRKFACSSEQAFITISPEGDFPAAGKSKDFIASILDFPVPPDWIMPLQPTPPPTLSQADVIIDLGYGIRDRSGLELAQDLKEKLEAMGLAPMFGATRKVTQDLKLQPLDAQVGQTGVRVNPRLIIALGISGAPQHIDYLGTRAEILCFNKDSEAPLMRLNQNRPAPRVHPIHGDMFVTIRELIARLG